MGDYKWQVEANITRDYKGHVDAPQNLLITCTPFLKS